MNENLNSQMFRELPPTKLFFKCAIPTVVTMLFGSLYQIADGIFVGRFIGQDALAAVNIISPILMMVFALSNMIATGSSVNASILLGEGKRRDASAVFTFSIKVIMGLSVLIAVLGIAFTEPFIRLIAPDASELAIEYGITYLKICSYCMPLIPVFFATDNFLRVCGKQKTSMTVNIASQVLNVVLDVILIVFLGQGVWAAAFATCISVVAGSVFTLLLFCKERLDLYYFKGKIEAKRFMRIIANGSSEFFSTISMSIMSLILNLFLLKYGGTLAVAAFSVVLYVDSVIGMINFGLCDALQPALSFCYGAGLLDRVKAIFKRVLAASVTTSLLAFVIMYLWGGVFASIFVKPGDVQLLEVSLVAIKYFAFSYIVGWMDMTFSSYFTALEKPGRSLTVAVFGTLVFPVACLFVLTGYFGLEGIWIMPLVSANLSGVLTLILYGTMKMKK